MKNHKNFIFILHIDLNLEFRSLRHQIRTRKKMRSGKCRDLLMMCRALVFQPVIRWVWVRTGFLEKSQDDDLLWIFPRIVGFSGIDRHFFYHGREKTVFASGKPGGSYRQQLRHCSGRLGLSGFHCPWHWTASRQRTWGPGSIFCGQKGISTMIHQGKNIWNIPKPTGESQYMYTKIFANISWSSPSKLHDNGARSPIFGQTNMGECNANIVEFLHLSWARFNGWNWIAEGHWTRCLNHGMPAIFVAMKVDDIPLIFIVIFNGNLFDYQRLHPNIPSMLFNVPSIFHYIFTTPPFNPHHGLPLSLPLSRHPVFTKDMRSGVLGQMTVAFFATWTGNEVGQGPLKQVLWFKFVGEDWFPKNNHICHIFILVELLPTQLLEENLNR